MTLEEAVKADMKNAIHDQLTDIVNRAVRKGYDLAKAELIHCKDCVRNENCFMYRESGDDNGYCAWAVRRDK